MKKMKIGISTDLMQTFRIKTERSLTDIHYSDLTDVSAVILSLDDIKNGMLDNIENKGFGAPVFVVNAEGLLPDDILPRITGVLEPGHVNSGFCGHLVDTAASRYEEQVLPPFFGSLVKYVGQGNLQFDCPGHQGGQFFRRHPAGQQFFEYFGESLFRSDLCNADVSMGDLLIHEGAPCAAQQHAARVYNADKTYFVLNGTSASNKVVLNAMLTKGDLVLFDRNNHKSVHHGALLQAGATPVYLETARNPFGFIGGIDAHCFDEKYLRNLVREIAPEWADEKRPFRLAVIQLGTYDGTIYNARQVVDRIGHLCDYILFDSAWVGYEQFIPVMKDCSPLLLELDEQDPGILVTQSVHKQQAGFSQTSQIHKKDRHIKGQERYCNHKRLNNAFMMHASTSPFYPLFAALDVNAMMCEGENGIRMWMDCVKAGIEARKMMLRQCKYIKPFIPGKIDGQNWEDFDTETISGDLRFFRFEPGGRWHSFDGYRINQYFVDPCKLMFTTPGINLQTGEYDSSGVPATVLANYLRENGIVPEKCDLNSILFLMTPAESMAKMQHLVSQIVRFEQLLDADAPLVDVLPSIYREHSERYHGYTLCQLCQEIHDLYVRHNVKQLQKDMFRKTHFPVQVMNPQDAHSEFIRGHVELVRLSDVEGRVAAEGALPYPPGVLCVVPGEIWGGAVLKYFLALEEGINQLPGFAPELQGVYIQQDNDGLKHIYCYVIKN